MLNWPYWAVYTMNYQSHSIKALGFGTLVAALTLPPLSAWFRRRPMPSTITGHIAMPRTSIRTAIIILRSRHLFAADRLSTADDLCPATDSLSTAGGLSAAGLYGLASFLLCGYHFGAPANRYSGMPTLMAATESIIIPGLAQTASLAILRCLDHLLQSWIEDCLGHGLFQWPVGQRQLS